MNKLVPSSVSSFLFVFSSSTSFSTSSSSFWHPVSHLSGYLILYDIGNRFTFFDASVIYNGIQAALGPKSVVLVGCKTDLPDSLRKGMTVCF
jgi:hypothetical protein